MCITPIGVKTKVTGETFAADCGKCPDCVKKRVSQWSFRLRKEAESSDSAFFLTMTYNSETLPLSEKTGYATLYPEHVTLWLKRLRKLHPDKKLKYYYVGEYGAKNWRPHYHMIIFNADIEIIDKTWTYGEVHYIPAINGATVGYMLKYIVKDGRIPVHRNDDRLPEFGRMSKGLGENYITPKTIKFHTHNRAIIERCHLVQDGKKVSMPRYYKDKIYNEHHKNQLQHYAKEYIEKKYELEQHIDVERKVQADLAKFKKMRENKYKNKNL